MPGVKLANGIDITTQMDPGQAKRAEGGAKAAQALLGAGPALPLRPDPAGPAIGERPVQPGALRRDALNRRALAAADLVAAAAALGVAVLAGGEDLKLPALLVLPLAVVLAKILGLYDRDEMLLRRSTLDEAPRLFQLATMWSLIVWLAEPLLFTGALDKAQVVGSWIGMFVLTLALRTLARQCARTLAPPERCVVLGDRASAVRLAETLDRTHGVRATVVAELTHAESLGHTGLTRLEELVRVGRIDRVILVADPLSPEEILEVARVLKAIGVKVSVVPGVIEVVGSAVELDDLGGLALLGLRRFGLTRSSALLKRSMDVVGASLGLLLLGPLIAVLAVAVRIQSPGPAFFGQDRVGRRDERFRMWKLRTMVDGATELKPTLVGRNEAPDGLFKIAEDPRLTRIGRQLRRLSLDELPQLWNVLRGDMSLVGPRPLVPEEDSRINGWDRRRLDLAPGMTGRWQIAGASRVPLRDMVTIDYLYVANWSLWGDVKVLVRTVPHVLAGRGL